MLYMPLVKVSLKALAVAINFKECSVRNFIKYPPLEWRKRSQYCTPDGPFFSSASTEKILISGSQLNFNAPAHSPKGSAVRQTKLGANYDILLDSGRRLDRDFCMPNDCWGGACLFSRAWAFYGPWMTGCKGELFFSVALIERFENNAFKNMSFFNPKAFEMFLVHFLNDRYGHDNWGGKLSHVPRYHGPVDWQRHAHLPVPSASFKVSNRGVDPKDLALPYQLFVFPVTDRHFIQICFIQEYYSLDERGEANFDTSPMQELQDNIFSSISLQLSSDAQARVDKVRTEVGNMQMCKEFAPLKWPTNIYPPEPSGLMPELPSLHTGN